MRTADDGGGQSAFGRFRVVTEPMGDGREIHYYEWPEEPPADEEAAAGSRATREDGPDE